MTTPASVQCASCGADNRLPRRYCGQCGAALAVGCAACGFANEPGTRFCGGCGASLAAAPAPAVASAGAPEPELRPVTVLFADVCGYTTLSQAMLPEEMHGLLQAFFAAADQAIARHGGRVDKHIGDAVMAVFGAPFAHGDEPMRAVRAAHAILDEVGARTAAAGRALELHIGIAAGEVVASGVGSKEHSAYTVVGPSVNLAARLTDVARPGEVVVDDAVHDAVAASCECVPLPGVVLKGLERPVTAWRVASIRGGEPPREQAFVGRRHELAQLVGALDACAATGAGSVAYVRGDPGIGKSRLVAELLRIAASRRYRCHRALVLDSGTARERDTVRELVAGLLDVEPGSAPEVLSRALTEATEAHVLAASDAALLAGLLDLPLSEGSRELHEAMDAAVREQATSEALVHLLRGASGKAPRVVLVEDLHWADEPTLRRMAALVHAAATLPVIVVLTSRRDGDPLSGAWRETLRGSLTTIDLGPLSRADAAHLAGGVVAASAQLVQRCIERAAGNPLFLEQLLRAAGEDHERLPASLHSLVLARVDRLPERERAALRSAAVIGQRFPVDLLRLLAGMPDYECDALLQNRLVQRDGADFLFAHAIIRDGVYASITHARRKSLHAQAGEWYRGHDAALCAEHLARADSPAAAHAYLVAAQGEQAALRPGNALLLAERGVAAAQSQADGFALQLLRADLLKEIGEGSRASEAGRLALGAASSPLERCRALLAIAAGHRLTGEADEALAALAEAEDLACDAACARERVALHYLRGSVFFGRSRLAESRAEHIRAHEQARLLGDAPHEARALSGLGDADYAQGLVRSAFMRFDACLALCDAHGLTRIAIPNRVMRGHCRSYLGKVEDGLRDMRAAAEFAVRVGNRHAEMFALQSIGVLLTTWNRSDEAQSSQERAMALAREIGARRYLPAILAHYAESLAARGDRKGAREALGEALAILRDTGMAFAGPMVLGMLMRLSDDARDRHALAAQAEQALTAGCISHNHFYYRRYGVEDALAHGELERALHHASALEAYTRAEPLPYTELVIRRARTMVAVARDPHDAAARSAMQATRADADALGWRVDWPA